MNTNFKVIGLTRLGIKPESTAQETDALYLGHLSALTFRPSECSIPLGHLSARAFLSHLTLEADRLGSILSRVKPKTLKLLSAVTLAKRSEIKCSAEDEMNRE